MKLIKNINMKVIIVLLIVLFVCYSNKSISQSPYEYEDICMVTVDTALNKNKIIWEKTSNVGTAFFSIYRDSTNLDNYNLIGTVPFNEGGIFVDQASNPSDRWYKYELSVIDTGENESSLSQHHKSIYLKLAIGTSGEINLIWNHYEGNQISSYKIFRGYSLTELVLLDEIGNQFNSYSDLSPPTGEVYYMISAIFYDTCNVGGNYYSRSFSNITDYNPLSIEKSKIETPIICIYPNPVQNNATLIIKSKNLNSEFTMVIYDLMGKDVKYFNTFSDINTIKFNRDGLQDGIYLYRLIDRNSVLGSGTIVLQ